MTVGFIGLGDMGGPIAGNIAAGDTTVVAFDKAGTNERAPADAIIAESVADVAQQVQSIFLSVPNGDISESICDEIIATDGRQVKTVIDLSTTGVAAAVRIGARLAEAQIVYADSPVSGGRAGASAGTITVIWGGPLGVLEAHRSVLDSMSGNVFHVGNEPGKGQAMKLLNNFLSATSMAATSEAVIFGLSQGLEFDAIIDVLNVSSGMNTATKDKFPNRIAPGTYDAGFRSELMRKDVRLYLESVAKAGTPDAIGSIVDDAWEQVDAERPGSDITEIFRFLRGDES